MKDFELRTDMNAAKLLGYKCKLHASIDTSNVETHPVSEGMYVSTLYPDGERCRFTLNDAATRDALVQALGEKYCIGLYHTHPDFIIQGWVAGNAINGWDSDIYETYTEAVRHAVDEVVNNVSA